MTSQMALRYCTELALTDYYRHLTYVWLDVLVLEVESVFPDVNTNDWDVS
jgi:hypothetical protein